ncbi:MAG: sulfur oxidation c-type cytochrome SoxX [Gammaproteobacteria bacterium]|nr:sulfur oxidation c-type cytochrome SoxX [Gammaproteobacteria bacterium]
MQKPLDRSIHVVLTLVFAASVFTMTSAVFADESVVENGKKVAFDRKAGNCLSCHLIEGGEAPGNLGPPLVAMKARFPDRQRLRDIIWDITTSRPEALMPPFGRYKIISEQDIDDIVEYLYTL